MIHWYEQVGYALLLLIIIQSFKFHFLGNEDIVLTIIKYFRKKDDSK